MLTMLYLAGYSGPEALLWAVGSLMAGKLAWWLAVVWEEIAKQNT